MTSDLPAALHAASILYGSESPETHSGDLLGILAARLDQYYLALSQDYKRGAKSLQEVQEDTAREALVVLARIHAALLSEETTQKGSITDAHAPLLGTTDLAHIRGLMSVFFKWGAQPLFVRIAASWPDNRARKTQNISGVIDLTNTPDDYRCLSQWLGTLIGIILPDGSNRISQTYVATVAVYHHLSDFLCPCIGLGWLPEVLASESTPVAAYLRPLIMRILSLLPPAQTITGLGGVLKSSTSLPLHVRKSCTSLLNMQLVRSDGIRGLCESTFGDENNSGDAPSLPKLEQFANVLKKGLPKHMSPESYYNKLIPQIVAILATSSKLPVYQRAVAFALSRMLAEDGTSPNQTIVQSLVCSTLHDPFLRNSVSVGSAQSNPTSGFTASTALSVLTILMANTDPSPTLVTALLSPIAPSLYTLFSDLCETKTIDPELKESVHALILTWIRVVEVSEGLSKLWHIVSQDQGYWHVSLSGEVQRTSDRPNSALKLLTPQDLNRAGGIDSLDLDSNILDLRPDPIVFVEFLKDARRSDMASAVFVRLLDAYRELQMDLEAEPMQILLYLQIIVQMQKQLSDDSSSAHGFLQNMNHVLSFVKHNLENMHPTRPRESTQKSSMRQGLGLTDLRIVDVAEDNQENADSDDDADDESDTHSEDMCTTTVNLLLATLEANPILPPDCVPILNDIDLLLEPYAASSSEALRLLIREARLVIVARLAAISSSPQPASSVPEEESQSVYQKALKLLQDPLLPVRAHGLMLLRQLVSGTTPGKSKQNLDAALVPAILSIFLRCLEDEDSYIFLNAVQGLSGMVDTFGKEVFRNLVALFTRGIDGLAGTTIDQSELDKRLRIGEALSQVIRRCGEALVLHSNDLIPPLLLLLMQSHLPTALRSSALSLLAYSAEACPLAMLPHSEVLVEAMVDILQVESVTNHRRNDVNKNEMDEHPTSTDPKLPPLRRAALHLIQILVRVATQQTHETTNHPKVALFDRSSQARIRATLGYVAITDEDAVARVMARETLEALDSLTQIVL